MSGTILSYCSPKTLIALLFIVLLGLGASAGAAQNVTISWAPPSSGDPVVAYRLYQDNLLLCETLDPAARTITCPAELGGNSVFTVAAVYGDGGEVIPPVANAGPDQVVNEGAIVTLDATNSYDIDDELVAFLWTQLDGPTVSLSDPTAIRPQFAAIDIGLDSVTLTFQLTVTDAQGFKATDVAIVNVVLVNEPPVAIAGADQTAFEGDLVVLDASGSTDIDDGIASYSWAQLSGPAMMLSDSTAMQPTFRASDGGLAGASVIYEVTVTDFGGLYTKDTVIINLSWMNTPPVADAGFDQIVSAGELVTLDGSLSRDEDDGIATSQWSQKTGLPVTLSDPTALLPEFETPADIPESVTLVFELAITDSSGLQHTDSCIVELLPLQRSNGRRSVLGQRTGWGRRS